TILVMGNQTAFPVEWLYLEADPQLDGVELDWGVNLEYNNDFFTVERSADGNLFTPIGTVESRGNSQTPQNYQAFDPNPIVGQNVYRIKQTDIDGAFTYSNNVVATYSPPVAVAKVYPNPVSSGEMVKVQITSRNVGMITFSMVDMRGKEVFSENRYMDSGNWTTEISTQDLAMGYYVLHIKGIGWQQQERILIEK
ncbi:MAG: T9SS type A sorting domain-containing protein, partial [Bacteroidota bacterium]